VNNLQSPIRNPQSHVLGLFGGTFNPVHNGHIEAARKTVAALGLCELIFVPACIPPHKGTGGLIPSKDRTRMLERAIRDMKNISWSDAELERKGTSYTIDTVRYFEHRYPDKTICFLTGSDSLSTLHTWKDIGTLISECRLVIISRPGFPFSVPEQLKGLLSDEAVTSLVQNRLEIETPDISSTQVRKAVKNGKDISSCVPAAVKEYIEENGLYR